MTNSAIYNVRLTDIRESVCSKVMSIRMKMSQLFNRSHIAGQKESPYNEHFSDVNHFSYIQLVSTLAILIILSIIIILTIFPAFITAPLPVPAPEHNTITCGVILPLSGDLSTIGTDILHGIEVAADEFNTGDTADGRKITLQIKDDKGDPNLSHALFQEMQREGVPVVIGSYSTNLTLKMAEETKQVDSSVLLSPQANGEALYGISPRFYQINPPIFYLAEFIGKWVSFSSDRVAILYCDDEYGRSVMNNIASDLTNRSIPVSTKKPINRDDTDYAALSHSILDSAPDTIILIVYDNRQIPIIRNLSEAGFRGQVILSESGLMNSLEKENSDVLSKFSLFTIDSYTNLVPGIQSEHFVSGYQKMFHQDPTRTLAGYGYDSMKVVIEALPPACDTHTLTAETIRKGLEASRYYGVSGPKVFDSHHAAGSAQDRWVFRDGKFVLMTTSLV
ncbi:MAG TPA: ABC transporter substrate-binding protein [Methanospirillum sp.]|uniref:ABC transporter substrate-binding protein n=1 Tax=Methanospirillum sp. TaxID=45200 RepID=UPI002CE28FBB|nr:ABC transporter substrate-binding protein [Methanospirillum sp.]HWQ63757.1 ABC transporter substrate-binding protein [Methanospirillum sp.]